MSYNVINKQLTYPLSGSFTGSLLGTASYATNVKAGGSNQSIQYNNNGALSGDSTLIWDTISDTLKIEGNFIIGDPTSTIISANNAYAFAQGFDVHALGYYSRAEGFGTYAYDSNTHAEGENTTAYGQSSHAEGYYTITSASYQHAQGMFNRTSSVEGAFILGNGTSNANRSNLIFAAGNTVQITGSLSVSGSITGSLLGTASYVTGSVHNSTNPALSASYALTASYALNAGSGGTVSTASLLTTASVSSNTITFTKGDGSTFPITVATGSGGGSSFPYTGNAIISGSLVVTGSTTSTLGFTGSLQGTSSWAVSASQAVTASYVLTAQTASYYGGSVISASYSFSSTSASYASTASYVLQAVSASFATTASYVTGSIHNSTNPALSASYAATASYAAIAGNGGVTQLVAGPNITLDPTNGLGQVKISSTGGSSFNTATGSYGSFYSITTQTNVASTARSMSLDRTDRTNGVLLSGSTDPFNTYIKTENAGVYNIQFSAQLDKTDSGADEIVIWLRKNGINLIDTATTITLIGNNGKQVAAWNWFVNSAANDYYQIIWQSADTNVRLLAESADGHPGIPSVIVTANRVDTFLSNTGSFSGSFNGVFTGSLHGTSSWAINAATASNIGPSISPDGLNRVLISNGNGTMYTTASLTYTGSTLTVIGGLSNGLNTIATSGSYSHAEGASSTANGYASHAEGSGTISSGSYSHAEGANTIANNEASHAEGLSTIANNDYSHAEGVSTTANGYASHAEGETTTTNGSYSHAEGASSIAYGNYSHAEGSGTISSGSYSHAEGELTIASGYASHAEGYSTITSASYQHAQGMFNIASAVSGAFILGNGTSNVSRSNLIFAANNTVQITGSLNVSGSITGSLLGTASYATTASYALNAGGASTNLEATVAWDGNGSFVSTGNTRYVVLPNSGSINGWSIVAIGTSPTITVDVLYQASGTTLPTASIAASALPTLSTGNVISSTTLTGWTSSLAAGGVLGFRISASANILQAKIALTYK